jgi:hypothetical protein
MSNQVKTKVGITDVLVITSGVVGAIVVYKIAKLTGLIKGEGETKVTARTTEPGSYWKPQYYKRVGGTIFTRAAAEQYAKKIYDALSWYNDDINTILGVFSQVKTKSQVSFLSDIFFQKYGYDLLNYLYFGAGRLWIDGLNDENINRVISYTDKLPAK